MLYACYDLIALHTVMELSWRKGLTDFSMPFIINAMAEQAKTVTELKRDNEERKAREREQNPQAADDNQGPILAGSRLMLTQGPSGMTPQPTGGPYGGMNGFR